MGTRSRLPNGLEMSRPASAQIVSRIRLAASGRVGSIELLGGARLSPGLSKDSDLSIEAA